MQRTDVERFATREILMNWADMSPGDISILQSAVGTKNAGLCTTVGTANFLIWENLERLGWAKRFSSPIAPPGIADRAAFFLLTPTGHERVPAFLEYYNLRLGTYYTDGSFQAPDAAVFNRGIETAAAMCGESERARGLTLEARMKLKLIDSNLVALALAAFAFDTKTSVGAFLGLHKEGGGDEVDKTLSALHRRIAVHWAFHQVGLPAPPNRLYDLADGLGVGLGQELAAWLDKPSVLTPRVAAWHDQYGSAIDKFCDHVQARTALPRKEAGS